MTNLWTLGGLSLPDLIRRTVRGCWQDEVFGQGGRMAFYHFLAIFPSLLIFVVVSTHIPHLGNEMKVALQDLLAQIMPEQVAQLFRTMMNELSERPLSGMRLIPVCAGALWAAGNATWAMIYGLNTAYEVEERRPWPRMAVTIAGLTASLAITGSLAVFLIFCGAHLPAHLYGGALVSRIVEWVVLTAALCLSFALLYRFAPNLRDHEWRWSTPGTLCAVILWLSATLAARFYFERVDDYSRSYGHLNGVVMLLLWLYVTSGAILIGGEMNSEIAKAAGARKAPAGSLTS